MGLELEDIERTIGMDALQAFELLDTLTPTQLEVANLMTDGVTPREIAEKRGGSPKTIDIHRAAIKVRLRCKTSIDVCRLVILTRLGEAIAAKANGKAKKKAAKR